MSLNRLITDNECANRRQMQAFCAAFPIGHLEMPASKNAHIIVLKQMNHSFIAIHILLTLLFLGTASYASGESVFTDDFTGGKSSRWIQINDGPSPGQFRVHDGNYVLISTDPATVIPRAIVSSLAKENYFIQAEVRVTPLQDKLSEASLVSYYSNSMHYYELALDTRQNYWSLQKMDKSGFSLMARGPAPAGRQVRRLGLYVYHGDIRVFLDGVMVAQETDPHPLPPGGFGLSARGAETEWQNVLVNVSNPQEFSYSFHVSHTDSLGKAGFPGARFKVMGSSGAALPGITVYRIHRDGISYFAFQDPKNIFSTRSGFLSEFQSIGHNDYGVILSRLPSGILETRHPYSFAEAKWLLSFLKRSARFSAQEVTADLKVIRNAYLSGAALEVENIDIGQEVFGSNGQQTELNAMVFGKPDEAEDYSRFPSVSGKISQSNLIAGTLISLTKVPQGSKFNIYILALKSVGSSSPASVSWIVQVDSRGVVVAESASFPKEALKSGSVYTVPFVLVNSGEKAGAFRIFFILSKNSSLARTDIRLKEVHFDGIQAGERISSQAEISIPANVLPGHYFIGTLLESESPDLRVLNGTATIRAVSVGESASNGQLEITLNWDDHADLDLHVTDPFGETIYYFHPSSISGGSLKEDVECTTVAGTEKITYPGGSAASGTYVLSVHYFRSCNSGKPVHWRITANADGRSQSLEGTVSPGEYHRAAEFVR